MGAKILCVLFLIFVLLSLGFGLWAWIEARWFFPIGLWMLVFCGMALLSLAVDKPSGILSAVRCIFKRRHTEECLRAASAVRRASDYSTVLAGLAGLVFCFYLISAVRQLLSWGVTPRWRALGNGSELLFLVLFSLSVGRLFLAPLVVHLSMKGGTLGSALRGEWYRDLLVVAASVGIALFLLRFSLDLELDILSYSYWRHALPRWPKDFVQAFARYKGLVLFRAWPIAWFILATWGGFSLRAICRSLKVLFRVRPGREQAFPESKAFFRMAASNALLIGGLLGVWEMAYGLNPGRYASEYPLPPLKELSSAFGYAVWRVWPPVLWGLCFFVFFHLLRLIVAVEHRISTGHLAARG